MEDKQFETQSTMEEDAQSRLAKLRAKHKSLRMKSIQKIEEAKNSLEYHSVSGDDQTINSMSSEGTGILSATSFSGSPFGMKLPQHQEITLVEENRRLKEQLAAFSARQEVSRKQSLQQAETIRKLRGDFQSLANNEIERIKQKLQEIAQDRNEIEISVREDWQQKEEEQQQDLERLREQLSEVQKQLKIAKAKLKQQDYHDWLDKWSRTIGNEAQHISKLLSGLEIRDPHSQRRLRDLRKRLDRWTQIAQNVQDLKSQEQQREMDDSTCSSTDLRRPKRLSTVEFDGLKAATEQVVVKLKELREQLDSAENEENIHNFEHQIEEQLKRWDVLEHRMDDFTHPALLIDKEEQENDEEEDALKEKAATINQSVHKANLAKTTDLTKSVKKVQILLEEIQMMVSSQHTPERQSSSSSSVSSSSSDAPLAIGKDLVPSKDNRFGAHFPHASRLGEDERPLLDQKIIEDISHKSSSSDDLPSGKQEGLRTIFEFDRTDASKQKLITSSASLSDDSTNSSASVEPFQPASFKSIEDLIDGNKGLFSYSSLNTSWESFRASFSNEEKDVEEEVVVFTNQEEEDDFEVASAGEIMVEAIGNDDTSSHSVRSDVVSPQHANNSRKHVTQGGSKVRTDLPQVMTGNKKTKSVISSSCSSSSKLDDLDAAKMAEYEAYLIQMSTKNFYGDSSDDDMNLESKDDSASVSSSRSSSSSSSSSSSRSSGGSDKSEEEPRVNPVSANADEAKVAQYEAYLMQMSTNNFYGDDNYDTAGQDDFHIVLPPIENWTDSSSSEDDDSSVSDAHPNLPLSSATENNDSQYELASHSESQYELASHSEANYEVASNSNNDSQYELASHSEANHEVASNSSDGDDDSSSSGEQVSESAAMDAGKVAECVAFLMQISAKNAYGGSSDNDMDLSNAHESSLLLAGIKNEDTVSNTDIADSVTAAEHEAYLMQMSIQNLYGFGNNGDADRDSTSLRERRISSSSNSSSNGSNSSSSESAAARGKDGKTTNLDPIKVAEYESYLIQMSTKNFYGDSSDDDMNLESRNSKNDAASVSSSSSSSNRGSSSSIEPSDDNVNDKEDNLDSAKVAEYEMYLNQMSRTVFDSDESESLMGLNDQHSTDAELSGPEIEFQMKAQKSLKPDQFMWLSTDDFQSSFFGLRQSAVNIEYSSDSSDGYNAYRNEALDELERYAKTVSQDKATNDGRSLKTIDSGGSERSELSSVYEEASDNSDSEHEVASVSAHPEMVSLIPTDLSRDLDEIRGWFLLEVPDHK